MTCETTTIYFLSLRHSFAVCIGFNRTKNIVFSAYPLLRKKILAHVSRPLVRQSRANGEAPRPTRPTRASQSAPTFLPTSVPPRRGNKCASRQQVSQHCGPATTAAGIAAAPAGRTATRTPAHTTSIDPALCASAPPLYRPAGLACCWPMSLLWT